MEMSADISLDDVRILTSTRWEPWQKEEILDVVPNATLLEPEIDGTLEELIMVKEH